MIMILRRNSTYTFSPTAGLIYKHVINSIHPAPHLTVYDALRSSFGRVFGLSGAASASGEVTRAEGVGVRGDGLQGSREGA